MCIERSVRCKIGRVGHKSGGFAFILKLVSRTNIIPPKKTKLIARSLPNRSITNLNNEQIKPEFSHGL